MSDKTRYTPVEGLKCWVNAKYADGSVIGYEAEIIGKKSRRYLVHFLEDYPNCNKGDCMDVSKAWVIVATPGSNHETSKDS